VAPSRPVGAPGRARRREEGVRRWCCAHERHTPRTVGSRPKAPCTCATSSPMARPGRVTWAHPIAVPGATT